MPVYITLLLLCACAHTSGQYVKWPLGLKFERLAAHYGVSPGQIAIANQGRELSPGEWVFIPKKQGLLDLNVNPGLYDANSEVMISTGAYLWPVPASKRISSEFGRRWGKKHDGIDIAAPVGSHILAVDEGKVIYSGRKIGGYGNLTIIEHKDGYYSVYAHAKRNFTSRGQRVHRGQVIAQVGMSGRSTGPHLHFEIRRNSQALDPRQYLAEGR